MGDAFRLEVTNDFLNATGVAMIFAVVCILLLAYRQWRDPWF